MKYRSLLACIAAVGFSLPACCEDGYDLWLRYPAVDAAAYPALSNTVREIAGAASSPTLEAARAELSRGLSGLAGTPLPVVQAPTRAGALIFGTPRSSPQIARLPLALEKAGA